MTTTEQNIIEQKLTEIFGLDKYFYLVEYSTNYDLVTVTLKKERFEGSEIIKANSLGLEFLYVTHKRGKSYIDNSTFKIIFRIKKPYF